MQARVSTEPTPEQKAANRRLALAFLGLVLTFFVGSFFFLPR